MTSFLLLVIALAALGSTQLLTNGNSQLPSCASTCPLLSQAAAACGGTTSATQQIWSCFCQSGYLRTLYTSPAGICDAVCTNPSDNQQVMTWYTTNCGGDLGQSEHANAGGATTVIITSTSTSPAASTVASSTNTAGAAAGSSSSSGNSSGQKGSWWSSHYKWVIMLIALFVGLLLLALIAVFIKRRYDRKQDQIKEGFNAGITHRSAPMPPSAGDMSYANDSQVMAGALGPSGDGRDSPARTRDSHMPYGYGYTRSESRLSAHQPGVGGGRRSPLARGETPMGDLEKDVGVARADAITPAKRQKRVLVRERSMEGPGSLEVEKGMR
ncbi:hypothetical protein LTR86_009552 [Recurvomyces mirabilis]|nr:hypothetical protein LTR86_009552 [Recurvomyces mirabilis]